MSNALVAALLLAASSAGRLLTVSSLCRDAGIPESRENVSAVRAALSALCRAGDARRDFIGGDTCYSAV